MSTPNELEACYRCNGLGSIYTEDGAVHSCDQCDGAGGVEYDEVDPWYEEPDDYDDDPEDDYDAYEDDEEEA